MSEFICNIRCTSSQNIDFIDTICLWPFIHDWHYSVPPVPAWPSALCLAFPVLTGLRRPKQTWLQWLGTWPPGVSGSWPLLEMATASSTVWSPPWTLSPPAALVWTWTLLNPRCFSRLWQMLKIILLKCHHQIRILFFMDYGLIFWTKSMINNSGIWFLKYCVTLSRLNWKLSMRSLVVTLIWYQILLGRAKVDIYIYIVMGFITMALYVQDPLPALMLALPIMVQWPLIQHLVPSRGPHIMLLYLPTLSPNVMPLFRAILAPVCPTSVTPTLGGTFWTSGHQTQPPFWDMCARPCSRAFYGARRPHPLLA